MRKLIVVFIVLIVIVVVTGLVFDWGRKEVVAPIQDQGLPIEVYFPKDNQEVKSPIKITGKARGFWFFEGSFPIDLVDSSGNIITSTIATSTEGWMTENFIDFSATLEFSKPTSTIHALLVLKKDNPSGNPDFDASIFIPVLLK